jgi:hypothetical protein
MECHDRPEELPHAKPQIASQISVKGLHEDDGSTCNASRFGQDASGIARVREHEDQEGGGES